MSRACQFLPVLAIALGLILFSASQTNAKTVQRKADCLKDSVCIDAYNKLKSEWDTCLVEAGLSEKKRKKLGLKVEQMGIRNLRKQEFLIFNSKRKRCHKEFYRQISELEVHKETDPRTKPPPLDFLEKKLDP